MTHARNAVVVSFAPSHNYYNGGLTPLYNMHLVVVASTLRGSQNKVLSYPICAWGKTEGLGIAYITLKCLLNNCKSVLHSAIFSFVRPNAKLLLLTHFQNCSISTDFLNRSLLFNKDLINGESLTSAMRVIDVRNLTVDVHIIPQFRFLRFTIRIADISNSIADIAKWTRSHCVTDTFALCSISSSVHMKALPKTATETVDTSVFAL